MPASLYRLAGKPHILEHAQAQAVDEVADIVKDTVAEQIADDSPVESEIVKDSPAWDPTWTKTRLFEFAVSMGLNVTSTNTKAEIISALESASSS